MTAQDKMTRLTQARAKVDEIARRKERLSGEIDAKQKRTDELEKRATDEFECEIADIPDLVESLDKEATEALAKAEKMLGMNQTAIPEEDDEEDDDEDAI